MKRIVLIVFTSLCSLQVLPQASFTADFVHQLFTVYGQLYGEDVGQSKELHAVAKKLVYSSAIIINGMPAEERAKMNWQHPDRPLLYEILATYCQQSDFQTLTTEVLDNTYYSIDSIISREGNTSVVYLNSGNRVGLTDSATGWAWTVYRSATDDVRPANAYLGKAQVTALTGGSAIVTITGNTDSEFQVEVGDQVDLQVPGRAGSNTLLGALMDYNIHFIDIMGEPLTDQALFRFLGEEKIQEDVFAALLQDVHNTADFLQEYGGFDTLMVTEGRFRGQDLVTAMSNATAVDMRMFLGFVRDYPGKYIGHIWRISETYATWLINGTLHEEEVSNWLIDSVKTKYQTQYFDPFIQQYGFYLKDTISQDWLSIIQQQFSAQQFEEARLNSEVLYAMGKALEDPYIQMEAMNNIGFSYQLDSAYFKAIDWYSRIIRMDSTYLNAYWNRSGCYGELDQYADAIADLEIVAAGAPWFSSAPGNIGWYYMKQGEIEKSAPYIKEAFALDSTAMAWNINYGHLKLLTGNKEEAYRFYQRTLDLLSSEEEYTYGPVNDFNLFLRKGWYKSEVQAAKDWMEDQYQRVYKHRVLSDMAWDSATVYKEAKDWPTALQWYRQALDYEMNGEKPRALEIYLYEGWIGRCHQEMEDYDQGVLAYQNALQAARQLGTDEVVNSFELLGWIHDATGEAAKAASYYAEAKALERLQADKDGSKELYVLAIGINDYSDLQYQWAEQDATAVAAAFKGEASLLFDKVHTTVLIGKDATRQGIQQAFTQVIEQTKPGDTFVAYFAGQTTQGEQSYLLAADYGVDTTNVIPARLLNNWLSLAPATKQLLVLDASDPGFASEMIALISSERDINQTTYQGVISPFGPRRERNKLSNALITHYIIEGLTGEANAMQRPDTMISIKELEAYVSGQLSKPENYEQVLSYIHGVDFGLAYTAPILAMSVDTIPPEIEVRTPRLTRGGLTETQEASATIEAKIFDGSGLKAVRLNNQAVTMQDGSILESFVSLAIGTNEYVIEAVDEFGNSATDTLIIKRVPQTQHTTTASDRISFGKPKSRNIALFIASDTYQEWNNLNNPVRDARAIQAELATKYGFEIDTLFNPTKSQFEDKVYSYLEGNFNEEDRLFVFIAGHGVYDNIMQDGYLATYDSEKNARRKEESYVPLSWLSMKLDRCRFNKIFVMIDACFGGAFGDIQYSNSGDKTRLYLTSGNKVYVDDGPRGGHSPFAYGILEVLRQQGQQQGEVTAMAFPVYLKQVEELQTEPRFGAFASSSRDPEFTFEFQQAVSGVRTANLTKKAF